MGALSIVRFRTVVRDTQDTAFVIFAVVVGMAVGASDLWVASIGLVVVGTAAALMRPKGFVPGGALPDDSFTLALRLSIGVDLEKMLGGLLDTALGWRAVFALYTVLGAAILALAWVDMGETRRPGLPPPRLADWAALLASPHYWAYVLCTAFSVGAFFVFVTGVPYVATATWGLTPALVGLGVGSITGGFMLGAAITARLAPRSRPARMSRSRAVASPMLSVA